MSEMKLKRYITIADKLKANEMAEKWGQKLPYPDAERWRQFRDAWKEKGNHREGR